MPDFNILQSILEMDARSDEFWLFRSYRASPYHIHIKFVANDGLSREYLDLKFSGDSIAEVVDKAYARFSQILGQMPEFDANRAITDLRSEPVVAAGDSEVPF